MSNDEGITDSMGLSLGTLRPGFLAVAASLFRRAHAPSQHGDAVPWLQALHDMRWFAFLCRLGGLHVFDVFAEARLAIAPRAVMERLLCLGQVRLITLPGFQHRGL